MRLLEGGFVDDCQIIGSAVMTAGSLTSSSDSNEIQPQSKFSVFRGTSTENRRIEQRRNELANAPTDLRDGLHSLALLLRNSHLAPASLLPTYEIKLR